MEMDPASVTWSIRLDASPDRVYRFLSTDEGRERFWVESSCERDGEITFEFPSGLTDKAEVLAADPPEQYVVEYFGAPAAFRLREHGDGGTILTLTHEGLDESERREMRAGWVSVLLALKAAVDFSVDLRNHDPACTWEDGFVDN